MNPYEIRAKIKLSLILIILLFLLYTIIELLLIKQQYIRRYVQLHYQSIWDNDNDDNNKYNNNGDDDNDEGILIPIDNQDLLNHSIIINNNTTIKPEAQISLDEESFHHNDNHQNENDESNGKEEQILTFIIVGIIFFVEIIYCAIYIYIIEQGNFCPVLCFATLSLISLLLRVRQFFTNNTDNNERSILFKYRTINSNQIKEMDAEQLLECMTKTDLIEISISTIETTLAMIYAFLLRRYPSIVHRPRIHYQQQPQLNGRHHADHVRTSFPNGHAIEMNEISNDSNDNSNNDQHQQQQQQQQQNEINDEDQNLLAVTNHRNHSSSIVISKTCGQSLLNS